MIDCFAITLIDYFADTLAGTAIFVAIISGLLTFLACFIRALALRWITTFLAPFIISYCIYWIPVWSGGGSSEYSQWVFVGVGGPFIAGFIASLLIILIVHFCHADKRV